MEESVFSSSFFLGLLFTVGFFDTTRLTFANQLPLVVESDGEPLRATVKLARGRLEGNIGLSQSSGRAKVPCDDQNGGCWQWADGQQLEMYDDPRSVLCKTVVSSTPDPDRDLEDCWSFSDDAHLYGGGSLTNQVWPVENAQMLDVPQVTGGRTDEGSWNNIHNRVWFSTNGVAIKVEDQVPLFVSVDPEKKTLCLKAAKKYPYMRTKVPTTLAYNVCYDKNLTNLYLGAMSQFFKPPTGTPDVRIFRSPVWNTWPKFKSGLNSFTLKEYVSNISRSMGATGVTGSYLIIGQGWETCIGDHFFSSVNFPRPTDFIGNYLKSLVMEATLWVHPRMGQECKTYKEGLRDGHFVTGQEGKVLLSEWNGNNVSSINFLDSLTVDWWIQNLKDLQARYGVTSFYFDHGQTSFLPKDYHFDDFKPAELLPDIYSTRYVDVAAVFGNTGFINVGRNSQNHPLFVRMPEKLGDTNNYDSLKSVIPSILQMGINGFPFILPEVIGGTFSENNIPDKRFYIRWLELTTFLPAMHFSVGPWEYGDDVVKIVQKMLDHRAQYMERIFHLAESCRDDGAPIIRPIWWISPDDIEALSISDQFLVGNELLVAPVVDAKDVRDIYLPAGQWKSSLTGEVEEGGRWLKDQKIDLDQLAFFDKVA